MDRKTGVLPMGFRMAKKPINTVVSSKNNWFIEFMAKDLIHENRSQFTKVKVS
jgi:hypothetical protein